MADAVMEFLNRSPIIIPALLFLLGMLAGITMTWLVMRN
jgi:hypothetical protein